VFDQPPREAPKSLLLRDLRASSLLLRVKTLLASQGSRAQTQQRIAPTAPGDDV
jgi:hypothetical protein